MNNKRYFSPPEFGGAELAFKRVAPVYKTVAQETKGFRSSVPGIRIKNKYVFLIIRQYHSGQGSFFSYYCHKPKILETE